MKKTWLKRLIAVSLAFIAAGTGTETMLYAQGNSVNSGGAFQVQEIIPEKKTEKTDRPEAAEIKGAVQTKSSEKTTEKIRERDNLTKRITRSKKLAKNGQTFLDVSKGDIRITKDGAIGGGL